MAFDQAGEGGLRRRLRLTREYDQSGNNTAARLGISVDILNNYLDNPEYVLTSDTYNTIVSNLRYIPVYEHVRAITHRWRITFTEKPQWTQGDVDSLVPPLGATQVVVFVFNDSYSDDVEAEGPSDLEIFTIQEIVEEATQGNLANLMTVVWYAPISEFPYPTGA